MKKAVWISVSIIIALAIGVGLWFWFGAMTQKGGNGNTTTNTPSASQPENADFTIQKEVDITIRDLAYSPSRITIKKGTRVTWTNLDTMAHTVTAEDPSNTGGLPTESILFGKDKTYSVVFNKTGSFDYYCVPHTFMRGTVEVID